jgi:8-oxo-dGTP pyrophosphatase MutT (NUDIX family)
MGKIKTRSAGIVVVRKTDGEYKFLMLRFKWFYDFPKGRNEVGETLLETAIRETEEEASISRGELSFRWGLSSYTTEPYLKNKDKTTTYFLAETSKEDIILPINPELGMPEHDSYSWLSYDEAKKVTNNRIGKVVDWANERITVK